jgi:hypothetical protein
MRRIAIFIFIGVLIGWSPAVSGEEITGPVDTVQQFFAAAKNGEMENMKNLITGPFLNRRKALIERNPGYPDFLIKQLEGIEIEIISTEIENDGSSAFVTVRRFYLNGSTFDTKFSLKKSDNDTWKIFDERLVQ